MEEKNGNIFEIIDKMGKERKEGEEEGVRILRRFRVLRVEIGVNGVKRHAGTSDKGGSSRVFQ